MIKKENYIQISGWMTKELNLSGNSLMVYALIHGFSQDGKSVFRGSLSYIQEWLNCESRQTVINTLKKLIEKGLIEKKIIYKNREKIGCEYWTTKSRAENSLQKEPSPNFRPPTVQKLENSSLKNGLAPSSNFGHNNINLNSKMNSAALNILAEKIFGKNYFDTDFPLKAAEFLRNHNISEKERYLEFIKSLTESKKPKNPRGFAYRLFFQSDIAEEFKVKQALALEEKQKELKRTLSEDASKISCPVCGERFLCEYNDSCPKCDFSVADFSNTSKIGRHRKFFEASPDKQQKYLREMISFRDDLDIFNRLAYLNTPQGREERERYLVSLDEKYGFA